jgi:hypothetical protein
MREFQQLSIDEDEWRQRQSRPWLHCALVIALYFSFFTCLLTLWLSGTLLDGADQVVPSWLLQDMKDHRVVVLVVPFVLLVACYILLRSLTGEIIAVPERYLDERQKVMRDQAQRSAFKIMKLSCFVIPALLLLQYLPWFHQPLQPPSVVVSSPSPFITVTSRLYTDKVVSPIAIHMRYWSARSVMYVQAATPANSAEIALAGVLLLLSLLLLFSALPMSVLAWKGKR